MLWLFKKVKEIGFHTISRDARLALIQVTYDSSTGAVSQDNFDNWCDGSKSDVHDLETCSDEMNTVLHAAVHECLPWAADV